LHLAPGPSDRCAYTRFDSRHIRQVEHKSMRKLHVVNKGEATFLEKDHVGYEKIFKNILLI
jgi:hypothetical protein